MADIADAVFLFRWEESTGARRQRVMSFEKFRGVMPHLEEQNLVKFAVKISTTGGFEVRNILAPGLRIEPNAEIDPHLREAASLARELMRAD